MSYFNTFIKTSGLLFAILFLTKIGVAQPVFPCIPINLPPADDCMDACFQGQTQVNTISSQSAGYAPGGVTSFCGSIENDQWIVVQAASVTGEVTVFPSNCTDGNGMQIAIYDSCGGQMIQCNVGCNGCGTTPQTISVNLVPGQFYYLLLDGWAGDQCEFTLNASGFTEATNVGVDSFSVTRGRVVLDEIANCESDSAETGLSHWLIEQIGNPTRYATTNSLGEYQLYAQEVGQHEIVLHKPVYGTLFWEACTDTILVNIPSLPDTLEVDFQVNKLVDCTIPMNEGHLNTWGRRPCFPTQIMVYIANYGNQLDSVVEFSVVLDQLLTFDSSAIAVTSFAGDTLNFAVNGLDFGNFIQFPIYCHLPCDTAIVGQTFCSQLILYNESGCDTIIGWSGASLKLSGKCLKQTEQAQFTIENKGTAPTTEPLPYIIIEDEVVLKQGILPAGLTPGQKMDVFADANGKTLRFEVAQEPNHPGLDKPSVFLEGCIGPVSPGMALQFSPNDADPQIDIDCHTITLSYDPNIKSAMPVGYLPEWNYIRRGDEMEYTIEFQNTGTDTAFSVVIRDTISPNLDLATLRMIGASHPYDWEIYGTGALRVWFPGIKLVDSLTNEAASKGFMRFRIGQKPDLPIFTQIFNKAAIYFDINAPVITNQTMHTIGEDLLYVEIISTGETEHKPLKINVLPNPFSEKTTIQMMPAPDGWKVLRVFTPDGRTCRTIKFDAEKVELTRAGLPDGLLFFSIEKDGAVLAAGKLLPK